jgi:aldose 1-epimerase
VIVLRSGAHTAVVDPSGAGLRSYRAGDRDVLDGCTPGRPCTAARGDLLIPWPNRITGATYRFRGVEHRLPVTEPSTGAALHGLTRTQPWEVVVREPDGVRLRHDLIARPGYPFALRCEVDYTLGAAGLRVRTSATNVGADPAPYATGAHPYLAAGGESVDGLTVQVPASQFCPVDGPAARAPVAGTPFDLRAPTLLGNRRLDHTWTALRRDADGRARVRVGHPDGGSVVLWLDGAYGYLQVFTGDTVPEPERRRRGLAVEPMTAAPDAFRTGDGLHVLGPGETHVGEWGISPGSPAAPATATGGATSTSSSTRSAGSARG